MDGSTQASIVFAFVLVAIGGFCVGAMWEATRRARVATAQAADVQLGAHYQLMDKNPWRDPLVVQPVEIRDGFVRYVYVDTPHKGSAVELSTFGKIYARVEQ